MQHETLLAIGCATRRRLAPAAGVVLVSLILLAACSAPVDPVPAPTRRPSAEGSANAPIPGLREAPWNLTPPTEDLPFVPGAGAPVQMPVAVRRTAVLTTALTHPSRSIEERTQELLNMARDRCAIGGFGLPLRAPERRLMARQAIVFFELMHPEISTALSPPWVYRQLAVDEFKVQPPDAMAGWMETLRLGDLPEILASGGSIVLLKRAGANAMSAGGDGDGRPARPFLRRRDWALIAVWLRNGEALAALHVVELHPRASATAGP